MKLDPEAVESEMNGLAVGVRGLDGLLGMPVKFWRRLYLLPDLEVGVDWSSVSSCIDQLSAFISLERLLTGPPERSGDSAPWPLEPT